MMTPLEFDLLKAKEMISLFIYQPFMDEVERRKFLVKAAKFAGCPIPKRDEHWPRSKK